MSNFLDYARDISDGANNAALAKAAGVHKSTVGRWETIPPTLDAVRALAHHYGRPVLEVAVAGGLLTPDEARITAQPLTLPEVTNAALLRELQNRLDAQSSDPSGNLPTEEEDPHPDDYDLAAGHVARPDHRPAD